MLTTDQVIALIKALGPTLAASGSALWIVITYLRHQKEARQAHMEQADRENKTRMFEARKPFNDKQLELYSLVAHITGKIVTTTDFSSPESKADIRRFKQLFWTELSMVEDEPVKKAMQCFSAQLETMVVNDTEHGVGTRDFEELRQRAYRLASTLRVSIASSWQVKLETSVPSE
jgi:hypothetical protein